MCVGVRAKSWEENKAVLGGTLPAMPSHLDKLSLQNLKYFIRQKHFEKCMAASSAFVLFLYFLIVSIYSTLLNVISCDELFSWTAVRDWPLSISTCPDVPTKKGLYRGVLPAKKKSVTSFMCTVYYLKCPSFHPHS